jgi:hypothetical protein
LHYTAIGWLNLAWEIAIKEVTDFQEATILFARIENEYGTTQADEEAVKFWNASRYKLNNAISLLQQSLEIELKARIAIVSPYLLIAGDPQSWPKGEKSRKIVGFSDFRTIDAIHLCRVHDTVSDTLLPTDFAQFYTDVRKARNKIVHLHVGNRKTESGGILRSILTAHGYLYDKGKWMQFRREHMVTEANTGPRYEGLDEDFTNDSLNYEFEAVRSDLEPRYLREFFGYDSRRRDLTCFNCQNQRTQWCDRNWDFAQRQRSGGVRCVVCDHSYTDQEYQALADEQSKELAEQQRKYALLHESRPRTLPEQDT